MMQAIYPGNLIGGAPLYQGLSLGDILYVTATGAGTFTQGSYPGLRAAYVECQGPGGAGGGAATSAAGSASGGTGGGAGAYCARLILASEMDASEAYFVGTGGTGVSAGAGNNGSAATTFTTTGGISMSAGVGIGGGFLASGAVTTILQITAGAPTATGGHLNVRGQPAEAIVRTAAGSFISGANGAPSHFSGGGERGLDADGSPGLYGSGGGGATQRNALGSARTGGAGGDGLIIFHLLY